MPILFGSRTLTLQQRAQELLATKAPAVHVEPANVLFLRDLTLGQGICIDFRDAPAQLTADAAALFVAKRVDEALAHLDRLRAGQ